MNLHDAVSDLHPRPPPCFKNRSEWREYLYAAAAAQNQKSEPKVILLVDGDAKFNFKYPFCVDCESSFKKEMKKQKKCKPNFLRKLDK